MFCCDDMKKKSSLFIKGNLKNILSKLVFSKQKQRKRANEKSLLSRVKTISI